MNKKLKWGYYPALNRLLFLFSLISFFSSSIFSQNVTGKVSDETGKGLSLISVLVKGTATGTTTDASGQYKISAASNAILLFSSVGYNNMEVSVNGRTVVNVTLTSNAQNLGEVVITALGITKQARGLGYSATNVKPDDLTVNRTPNVINALQGKVAGLNISSMGTGPGGTSKIRIRGQSSLGGGNTPLIVINGVPVDRRDYNGSTVGVTGGGVYADGGDAFASINPDDIESMTILKGAPAAALYGSRAQDGVIMITTKTKGKGRGIGVTYNVNYTNETPLDYTDWQKEYGQGENGFMPSSPSPTSGEWSFGPKIQPGITDTLFGVPGIPYVAQGSRIKEFYRHGQNLSNTITLETSGEKGGLHLSLNNTDNLGIVPNNKFDRKVMNLGYNYNLSDKLSFSGNVNYSRESNKNPPNIGNQDNTIPTTLMALANTMPLSVMDANKYKPAVGNEYPYTEYIYSRFMNRTNPYWILAEQFHNIKRDRIFGNVTTKYNILPWLSIQGRFGQDYYSRDEDVNNFPSGQASRASAQAPFINGIYTQESRRFRETNLDFLINANRQFGNFNVTVTGGGNQMRQRLDVNNVQVTDFVIRRLYTVQNGRSKNPVFSYDKRGVNSLYGSGEISWKRTLYLNGTVRNDWFSTLAPENNSILYPSVSGAYVFSETLKDVSWLNFGKLRLGYAEVGSDGNVGFASNFLYYTINSNLINTPAGSQATVASSGAIVPNATLRPSRTKETELGLELKMFNSRVNLDLAVYRKLTIDQIVSVQISDASGFTNRRINSGKSENRGIEAVLNLVPIRNKDFSWEFTANTAFNKTKCLSIITNTPGERITVGTHVFNGEVRIVVGQEMEQIAGYGYARDAKGQMVIQSNGLPQRTPDLVLFGNALPKWTGGFLNTFNYKGISLSVFIDYKLGNKVLSGTNFNAIREGLHKITLEGRPDSIVANGVTSSGSANTKKAGVQTYWEHLRSQQIVEPVIYNGGFWKLRQITLGYDFTKFVPAKWPVKGIKVDFVANNVFIIKKWIDNVDPESFGYAADSQAGLESPSLPTTRSIGVNVNIKF
jgi:TonB-linked SusC/RagA family outer membrane protein